MIRFPFYIIILLLSAVLQAQEVKDSLLKNIIFSEDFQDNSFGWVSDQTEEFLSIENGLLKCTFDERIPKYTDGVSMKIDTTKNFGFELSMKWISGNPDYVQGLLWGNFIFKDDQNMKFVFFPDGYYKIYQRHNGHDIIYKSLTKSDLVKKEDFNTLKVIKMEDKFFFYLNQVLVYKMSFAAFPFGDIGFQLAPGSIVYIDYFRIFYLEKV